MTKKMTAIDLAMQRGLPMEAFLPAKKIMNAIELATNGLNAKTRFWPIATTASVQAGMRATGLTEQIARAQMLHQQLSNSAILRAMGTMNLSTGLLNIGERTRNLYERQLGVHFTPGLGAVVLLN